MACNECREKKVENGIKLLEERAEELNEEFRELMLKEALVDIQILQARLKSAEERIEHLESCAGLDR